MKRNMKKPVMVVFLITTLILGTSLVYADMNIEAKSIQLQTDSLLAAVDVNSLHAAAMENAVDPSVPHAIRESISIEADFCPLDGVEQDAIDLEVNSTVQKVGEIVLRNGEKVNLYVAAVAATEKTEIDYKSKHGIKAWAYLWWIDNFGPSNELVGAGASWEPGSVEVKDREIRFGTSDILGLTWSSGPTLKTTTKNDAYYSSPTYVGLTLRVQTKINVVNLGTVTCNVISGLD